MATPDLDIATHLAASSPSPDLGALGTDIFLGGVRGAGNGIPHDCIFVLQTGGRSPGGYVGNQSGSIERWSSVQVRVRSDVNDFEGGQSTARSVWSKLHHASITGYVIVQCIQAEPVYLGQDAGRHHEWSINVEALYFV